jgi:DNA (cytosine-5)-methyltransferase 1
MLPVLSPARASIASRELVDLLTPEIGSMNSLDLFCGAGGLTRGLEAAGFDTIGAIDIDPAACATYRENFPDVEVIHKPAQDVDFSRWCGSVELLAGGPPCQPFSVAGHQRSHLDPRDCIPQFIRAVDECKPLGFLLENVPGLVSPRHGVYFQAVLRFLSSLGYNVRWALLDAADYGVAQHRTRVFIVGLREGIFHFPHPTHGEGRGAEPYVCAEEVLRNPPADFANTAIVTYARKPVLRPQPWDGMLVNGGGRPINLREPCQTIPASAGGNRTHILDFDGVLVNYHAHLMAGGIPRHGVVEGVRRLTVAESSRIQSFPDAHRFLGRQSSRYRQVGNAVPPGLASAVTRALASQIAIIFGRQLRSGSTLNLGASEISAHQH